MSEGPILNGEVSIAAQQAVAADGRASSQLEPSYLSPVVEYHGLAHRYRQAFGLLMRPQLNGGTLGRPLYACEGRMKDATRTVTLEELASRLSGAVPAAYRAYTEEQPATALAKQGFDPKTLLILNLELQQLPRYNESEQRFFLSGDGCGNYYFVDLSADDTKVLLWAHDPPGIEDPDHRLEEFLRDSEQTCRIDWPIERGSLWLCRTCNYAESILDPISLDEWSEAVRTTEGLEYQGYREMKNPFTGEVFRIDTPGRTRVLGLKQSYIEFFHGRAHCKDNPVSRPIATILAKTLRANLLT